MTDTHALGSIEPVAWCYELATHKDLDGQYCEWVAGTSRDEPVVPFGSIRNVEPLYALPADFLERVRAMEAALEFYADPETYAVRTVEEQRARNGGKDPTVCITGKYPWRVGKALPEIELDDCGNRARAALSNHEDGDVINDLIKSDIPEDRAVGRARVSLL